MVGLVRKHRCRCGLRAGAATHQLHRIPHGDFAPFDHKTVEGKLALEAPVDVTGDFLVPDQGVWIVGSHDAAQTQILDTDEHLAYAQTAARPLPLGQPLDAPDHDVGPQAAMVVAEGGNGAVGGYQERQHVEALHAVIAHQLRARPANVNHRGGNVWTVPGPAIHQRFAIRTQRTPKAQKTRMGSRGDHPLLGVFDVDNTVAFDTERPDADPLQLLAGHGLDRISPDLRDLHDYLRG